MTILPIWWHQFGAHSPSILKLPYFQILNHYLSNKYSDNFFFPKVSEEKISKRFSWRNLKKNKRDNKMERTALLFRKEDFFLTFLWRLSWKPLSFFFGVFKQISKCKENLDFYFFLWRLKLQRKIVFLMSNFDWRNLSPISFPLRKGILFEIYFEFWSHRDFFSLKSRCSSEFSTQPERPYAGLCSERYNEFGSNGNLVNFKAFFLAFIICKVFDFSRLVSRAFILE